MQGRLYADSFQATFRDRSIRDLEDEVCLLTFACLLTFENFCLQCACPCGVYVPYSSADARLWQRIVTCSQLLALISTVRLSAWNWTYCKCTCCELLTVC